MLYLTETFSYYFLMKNYHDIVFAFITQPQQIEDVFGGEVRHLKLGLETLIHQLNAQGDQNLTRYWLSLLALEGKLSKNPDAKQTLGNRISRLKEQEIHYARDSETMLSIMANIYSDVISPLGKKIHILGSPDYLRQELVQNKIRAVLLAGIRSAVLWKQMGGTKWQILFSRRKLLATAKQIYSSIY